MDTTIIIQQKKVKYFYYINKMKLKENQKQNLKNRLRCHQYKTDNLQNDYHFKL